MSKFTDVINNRIAMKAEVLKFIRERIDKVQLEEAVDAMYYIREPLEYVDVNLFNEIYDLLEEYGSENDLAEGWWYNEYEIEELLLEL